MVLDDGFICIEVWRKGFKKKAILKEGWSHFGVSLHSWSVIFIYRIV